MAQYPFGIGGGKRSAPSLNPRAWAAVGVAALSWLAGILLLGGVFAGGQCGDFGFRCMGHAIVGIGVGSVVGTIVALCAFDEAPSQRWLCWLALLLNGVPAAGFAVMAFLIYLR